MSSEHIIEEQKAANLARIRDNQRRSRARRKEYLQELEERYRVCEQIGVEASAEMQAAARRVIEENRFLRTMLKQQGYTDADIDRAIQEGTSALPAVPNLEALFGKRRRPDSTHGGSSSSGQMQNSSASSSQATPLMSGMRQLQGSDHSPIGQLYSTPYASSATSGPMPGSSMTPHGLVYNEPSPWPVYAASHTNNAAVSSRLNQPHYDGMPSIQSIKSEVGYGPQEEIDCQSTDADYSMSEEQAYDAAKRYSR